MTLIHSDLGVCESGDGHSRDPAVLQVPKSWRNSDLVQEVHPLEVIVGHHDNVGGEWQGRTLVQGQVRHLRSQTVVASCDCS